MDGGSISKTYRVSFTKTARRTGVDPYWLRSEPSELDRTVGHSLGFGLPKSTAGGGASPETSQSEARGHGFNRFKGWDEAGDVGNASVQSSTRLEEQTKLAASNGGRPRPTRPYACKREREQKTTEGSPFLLTKLWKVKSSKGRWLSGRSKAAEDRSGAVRGRECDDH